MANFVKVDFAILDVETQLPLKSIKYKSRYSNNSSNRISSPLKSIEKNHSKADIPRQANNKVINEPPNNIKEVQFQLVNDQNDTQNNVTRGPSRPSSAISQRGKSRGNPNEKMPNLPPPWQFSELGVDRDDLILSQDIKVIKYKERHPIFDEPKQKREPSFSKESQSRNVLRERIIPTTSGTNKNYDLPFHPTLRKSSKIIHDQRWSVQTTLSNDSYERFKPLQHRPTTSHEDFYHAYHAKESWREHKISIVKNDAL